MTEEEKKEYQKLADDAAQVAISALSYVKPYQGYAVAVGQLSTVILADALKKREKQDPNQPDPDF